MALENNFISKLAQPAQRALKQAGVVSISDIAKFAEQDLLQLHGIGARAMADIRKALQENGLSFNEGRENEGEKRTNP